MAAKEEAVKIERELFARTPRHLLQAWIKLERDEAIRYLLQATDPVAIHRAQGQVHILDKLDQLSAKYTQQ